LAAGTLEPKYERSDVATKLSDYEPTLVTWFHSEQKKPRKDRKQIKQLHQALVGLGFTGSYDRVAAFVRRWRMQTQSQGQVRDARHRLWQSLPTVKTLKELNKHLASQCAQCSDNDASTMAAAYDSGTVSARARCANALATSI